MDFMELPKDRHGYDTVFVTVDRLSKRAVSVPCRKESANAKEMAKLCSEPFLDSPSPADSFIFAE